MGFFWFCFLRNLLNLWLPSSLKQESCSVGFRYHFILIPAFPQENLKNPKDYLFFDICLWDASSSVL